MKYDPAKRNQNNIPDGLNSIPLNEFTGSRRKTIYWSGGLRTYSKARKKWGMKLALPY